MSDTFDHYGDSVESQQKVTEEVAVRETVKGEGFEFSPETDQIIPAFVAFQSELKFAEKTSENPFFHSKYADLKEVWSVIKEPLEKNYLSIMQFPTIGDFVEVQFKQKIISGNKLTWNGKYDIIKVKEIVLTTMLIHKSGQYVKTWYSAIPEENGDQARGKCITYSRRYTLMPLLGVTPEDDDGNPTPKITTPATVKTNVMPKPNPDNMIYDEKRRPRYDKQRKLLDDNFQKESGMILTAEWSQISSLIKSNLGGNIAQFSKWVRDAYGVKWYDIKTEMFAGILKTLKDHPNNIMDHGLEKKDHPNNIMDHGLEKDEGLPY